MDTQLVFDFYIPMGLPKIKNNINGKIYCYRCNKFLTTNRIDIIYYKKDKYFEENLYFGLKQEIELIFPLCKKCYQNGK